MKHVYEIVVVLKDGRRLRRLELTRRRGLTQYSTPWQGWGGSGVIDAVLSHKAQAACAFDTWESCARTEEQAVRYDAVVAHLDAVVDRADGAVEARYDREAAACTTDAERDALDAAYDDGWNGLGDLDWPEAAALRAALDARTAFLDAPVADQVEAGYATGSDTNYWFRPDFRAWSKKDPFVCDLALHYHLDGPEPRGERWDAMRAEVRYVDVKRLGYEDEETVAAALAEYRAEHVLADTLRARRDEAEYIAGLRADGEDDPEYLLGLVADVQARTPALRYWATARAVPTRVYARDLGGSDDERVAVLARVAAERADVVRATAVRWGY